MAVKNVEGDGDESFSTVETADQERKYLDAGRERRSILTE
jgi:hypothetical protein